jgi:hypothetical protein
MQAPTTRQIGNEVQRVFERIFEIYSWGWASLALLILVPLTLWFVWRDSSPLIFRVTETVFCLSWVWAVVSLLQMFRVWREVGLTPVERLHVLSAPRPNDPDELRVWKSAWQFMIAVIAAILFLIAIPLADSLAKK